MKYRTLGRTGVQVSTLALGTMNFGALGRTTQDDATAMVRCALDAGINFIDTADVYSRGESEEMLGKALAGVDRDNVVLATKFRLDMGGSNRGGGSRRWIVMAVEDSLRRLGTDRIDLYQMHRPAPDTDIEETLSALDDLQRAGKVLYVGSSTFSAAEVVEAQWASERRNLVRFTTEQPPYSMLTRGIEADVLPVAARYGMGVLVWGPLAGGFLSGKYRPGHAPTTSHRDTTFLRSIGSGPGDLAKQTAAEQLYALAEQHGMTLIEMALAFTLSHSAVTSAIIGPRTLQQLESYLGAADLVLTSDVLDAIDAIVEPGRNLKPSDASALNPALKPANRRR
jgi:aryl-alcohol dehydrogenase-like predicted oxidoreductase